jgi:hypothetical protein
MARVKDIHSNFVPSPFIYSFQLALYNKIISYGRESSLLGTDNDAIKNKKSINACIKTVWNAIDPKFINYNLDNNNSVDNSNKRINFEAFRKGVQRLEIPIGINENMKFGIQGNILFMLHIFDILRIKNYNDLLSFEYSKPDLQSLILTANNNTETIKESIEELKEIINHSIRKKPRIPNIKLLRAWEHILFKIQHIINIPNTENNLSQFNNSWDFNTIIYKFSSSFAKDIQFAIHICTLLNEYKEYFVNDNILHNYINKLLSFPNIEYNSKHPLIILSPLYLLYFFCLFQNRFINIFLKEKYSSSKQQYNLFMSAIDETNNILNDRTNLINNDVKENPTLQIYKVTNYFKNITKKIILLTKSNPTILHNLTNIDYLHIMKSFITLFLGIYSSSVNYDQSEFIKFLKDISCIQDLYNNFSLGKPLIYFISNSQLNEIDILKHNLDNLYLKLSRPI